MRPRVAVVALLVALLLAPPSLAQAPTPTSGLSVTIPAGPMPIPLGAKHEIPLSVTLTLANIACAQDATVSIPITVAASPAELPTVMAHSSVTEERFTIPAGAYQNAASVGGGPFNKSVDATLVIMVKADAPANHTHAFIVAATYPGGTPTGCQAAGDVPKAMGSAKHTLITGPADGTTPMGDMQGMSGMRGMSGMGAQEHQQMSATGPTSPPAKQTPGVSPALVIGLGVAIALVLRRRAA